MNRESNFDLSEPLIEAVFDPESRDPLVGAAGLEAQAVAFTGVEISALPYSWLRTRVFLLPNPALPSADSHEVLASRKQMPRSGCFR